MSALCPILRGSFDDYLRGALPAPQRRILRAHLAACPECRDLAVAQDVTLAFARPFPEEPVPAADAEQILANVRTAVAFAQTERRIRRTSRHRIAGAAAAAAAFGALVLMAPGGGARRFETLAAAGPTPPPAEAAPVLRPAALPAEAEGLPAEATVYDWNPGAVREEPRVVWIVDQGLDI